ncbi:hypothetical protein GCM10010211_80260 [Streptomyces albospinus]|uniref:Uncharacterized protein n=1 Tax=Streptomyces albospinus TaxID=285515 RepID=A0ABQ2VN02_9ACTN|nr:hypothetical protein [Streptomyces albospinus]GGV00866.1 hypothetical protein GCM10010211_80260 [Streptomyces albospinus]
MEVGGLFEMVEFLVRLADRIQRLSFTGTVTKLTVQRCAVLVGLKCFSVLPIGALGVPDIEQNVALEDGVLSFMCESEGFLSKGESALGLAKAEMPSAEVEQWLDVVAEVLFESLMSV